MATETRVAAIGDVPPGTAKVVQVNGKDVALYNIDGHFHATSNVCPHQGGPLGEGIVEGSTVICPWHAWAFDVRSGVSPVNPRAKIETYPVRVSGQDVFVSA